MSEGEKMMAEATERLEQACDAVPKARKAIEDAKVALRAALAERKNARDEVYRMMTSYEWGKATPALVNGEDMCEIERRCRRRLCEEVLGGMYLGETEKGHLVLSHSSVLPDNLLRMLANTLNKQSYILRKGLESGDKNVEALESDFQREGLSSLGGSWSHPDWENWAGWLIGEEVDPL